MGCGCQEKQAHAGIRELVRNRLEVCESCEHQVKHKFHLTRTCSKCGCLIEAKVRVPGSKCPIGNW